jgi:hypothetical protein
MVSARSGTEALWNNRVAEGCLTETIPTLVHTIRESVSQLQTVPERCHRGIEGGRVLLVHDVGRIGDYFAARVWQQPRERSVYRLPQYSRAALAR